MESKQATTTRDDRAEPPPGDPAALPVPPLARPAIVEYQRQIAAANAALQTYLAGLAAGLDIPADRIAGIDLDTWTIRLRAEQPELTGGADGRGPVGPAAPGT